LNEIQRNKIQPSDFVSSLENIETAVERLSTILEGMKELENHWKNPQEMTNRVNTKIPNTEEDKHLTNLIKDEKPAETPHREPKETHDATKMMRAKFQNAESEVPETRKTEKGSSRNDYYILAIALVIFGVIIFKLCSMLF
jgi:hypothetical protein